MSQTKVADACNSAINSALQHMLDNPELEQKPSHEVYPIMALPIVGGDWSVSCQVIEHRRQAIKVSNGLCEVWLPRSQVRQIIERSRQVIITEWILNRKSKFFRRIKNESPQYLEWIEKQKERKAIATDFIRNSGGFQYKFDGKV